MKESDENSIYMEKCAHSLGLALRALQAASELAVVASTQRVSPPITSMTMEMAREIMQLMERSMNLQWRAEHMAKVLRGETKVDQMTAASEDEDDD